MPRADARKRKHNLSGKSAPRAQSIVSIDLSTIVRMDCSMTDRPLYSTGLCFALDPRAILETSLGGGSSRAHRDHTPFIAYQ